MTQHLPDLLLNALGLFLMILVRYFLLAGVVFWMLQRVHRTPSAGEIRGADIRRDIRLSVQSAVVFAITGEVLILAERMGLTRIYEDPLRFGGWYLGASYLAVLLLQDTAFYFSHRLFHHPRLYGWVHASHHRSRQPTPWTSFAFDTPEAIVQALLLLLITFLLPVHAGTLIAVLATMSVWAVINHLGMGRLPDWFPFCWLGRWFIGPAHHGLHHRDHGVHYGLYFTFWDRWLGTEDPCYLKLQTSALPEQLLPGGGRRAERMRPARQGAARAGGDLRA